MEDGVVMRSPTYGQNSSIRDYGNQEIVHNPTKSPHRHVKNNSSIDSFAHRNKNKNSKDVTLQSATDMGLEMSVTKADAQNNAPEDANMSP